MFSFIQISQAHEKSIVSKKYNTTILFFLQVKLTTVAEGNPKDLFSWATSPRCKRERYSIPRIGLLYPWSVLYNAEF